MSSQDAQVCRGAVQTAHDWMRRTLRPGDIAIDATVGNGHDAVFLASRVGDNGHVYGFDVQEEAISQTVRRLKNERLKHRVTIFETGHENMAKLVPNEAHGHLAGVMFNLGYLPGGENKHIVTNSGSTVLALNAALKMLTIGGVIAVVAYTGHDGGEEAFSVRSWAMSLDQDKYAVVHYSHLNQKNSPPQLFAIERLG